MKKIIALIGALALIIGSFAVSTSLANAATQAETCTPKAAWTETVVDKEAYDEQVTYTQHYSLKGNSGIGKDEVPVFPADYWQANTDKEPAGHYNSAQKPDGSLYSEGDFGLHYTSAGSSGNRDWFYFGEFTDTVHHDAVTHTVEHPAVTCDPETPTPDPTPTDCVSNDSCLPHPDLGPAPKKHEKVVTPTVVHAGL